MLSIWTASTLSIACGSMDFFKHEPPIRRSLSCSSLFSGKSKLNLNRWLKYKRIDEKLTCTLVVYIQHVDLGDSEESY